MKRFINFIKKINKNDAFVMAKYTVLFFVILAGIYVYEIYYAGASTPAFTYADF